MKHIWTAFAFSVVVLAAQSAAAQVTIDGYQARFYLGAATQPVQQTDVWTFAASVCNQDPPPLTASTSNPNKYVWNDPINAGKVCIYQPGSDAALFSIPLGNWSGTIVAINSAGSSPESNRAPFKREPAPPAPTGFRVIRAVP